MKLYATLVSVVLFVTMTAASAEPLTFTKLTLSNGWIAYPNTWVPSAAVDGNDFVHLRGGVSSSSANNRTITTLPMKYRPKKDVYIPVSLINGKPGRIAISVTGDVRVQPASGISTDGDAYGFTSLDNVSYPRH